MGDGLGAVLESFLECSLCHEQYENPKMLKCTHVFCKDCLEDIVQFESDGSTVITCPLRCCEQTILQVTQTVNDLPSSYNLRNILETLKAKNNTSSTRQMPSCVYRSNCGENISVFCCDNMMCRLCYANHYNTGTNHKTRDVCLTKGNKVGILCDEHVSVCTYICENDLQLLCQYCVNRKNSHTSHMKKIIKSEAETVKDVLHDVLSKQGKVDSLAFENIENLKGRIRLLLEERKSECLLQYKGLLDAEEASIMKQVERYCQAEMDGYTSTISYRSLANMFQKQDVELALQKDRLMEELSNAELKGEVQKEFVYLSEAFDFRTSHPLGSVHRLDNGCVLNDAPIVDDVSPPNEIVSNGVEVTRITNSLPVDARVDFDTALHGNIDEGSVTADVMDSVVMEGSGNNAVVATDENEEIDSVVTDGNDETISLVSQDDDGDDYDSIVTEETDNDSLLTEGNDDTESICTEGSTDTRLSLHKNENKSQTEKDGKVQHESIAVKANQRRVGHQKRNHQNRQSPPARTALVPEASNSGQPEYKANINMTNDENEWFTLSKLCPETERKFTVCVEEIGSKVGSPFQKKSLLTHFGSYNVYHDIRLKSNTALVSFPSLFTAYRAWKERDKSAMFGHRISVKPACGNLDALSTRVFKVMVLNVPDGIVMSTLVTKFAKFGDLACVDVRPSEKRALISYLSKKSAQRACLEAINVRINGTGFTLKVKPIDENLLDKADENPDENPGCNGDLKNKDDEKPACNEIVLNKKNDKSDCGGDSDLTKKGEKHACNGNSIKEDEKPAVNGHLKVFNRVKENLNRQRGRTYSF